MREAPFKGKLNCNLQTVLKWDEIDMIPKDMRPSPYRPPICLKPYQKSTELGGTRIYFWHQGFSKHLPSHFQIEHVQM